MGRVPNPFITDDGEPESAFWENPTVPKMTQNGESDL